jgi:malate synthase
MEDAATAEISRVQIWQWLRHQAQLNDGRIFNQSLFERVFSHEVEILRRSVTSNCLDQAIALFKELVTARQCEEFLTLAAYSYLL